MRVTLDVDGRPTELEVDLAAGTARIGDRSFPVKVVADTPSRVELEIDGEKILVEGWWPGVPSPPEPVAVDGERFRVSARVESAPGGAVRPVAPAASWTAAAAAVPTVAAGEGTGVVPPMPGKVVEVRVQEGDAVTAGQVLLVLEAMKMRNEVTAPIAGIVRSLSVSPGSNVRAREPMLRIVPP